MMDSEIEQFAKDLTNTIRSLLEQYGEFGYPYYVDEEDSNLEECSRQIDELSKHPNPYISCLGDWSNERAVIPIRWLPLILKDLGLNR